VSTTSPTQPAQTHAVAQNHAIAQALADAVTTAGHAPSIHNTQPWQWRLTGDHLDLYLEPARLLEVTDPDTRLATLSCGAALNHARVSLAAAGWRASVDRMPNPVAPGHLARLIVTEHGPADPQALQRMQTIRLRYTDRRPVTGPPVGDDELRAITTAVESEGTWLHILQRDQVLDLAAAVDHAQSAQAAQPAWQAELASWTGGARPTGAGVPDAAIPGQPPQTTVPGRDFGHHGDLPIDADHDQTAVFAMLYGYGDQRLDWLHAGEGLSAAWLTATELGVTVLPLSAPIEVAGTRETLRRLIADLGHPYLVLRLGTANPNDTRPPHTPRLPIDQTIQ
jgi:nitroreductase